MFVDSNGVVAPLVPALIAAAGYAGKLVVDAVREWRGEKEVRRAPRRAVGRPRHDVGRPSPRWRAGYVWKAQ